VFSADMKYLVFRPYWEVPYSIQRDEIVPALEKDHSYLAKNRFEAVDSQDRVADTSVIGKALLAKLRSGQLHIRQKPGPENSLGLVKFMFPNPYDVYLHGTPAQELFSRSRRDFSHGCIRVEDPVKLAEWVFSDQPDWTRQRIVDAMHGKDNVKVTLDRPIPVLIVYATAVVMSTGEVHFLDDIYGQDAALEGALADRYSATSAAPAPRPRE
jgi:murein L,D-transpeptidase YcbB/YkuD